MRIKAAYRIAYQIKPRTGSWERKLPTANQLCCNIILTTTGAPPILKLMSVVDFYRLKRETTVYYNDTGRLEVE